jgi:hypothetical protein
MSSASVGFCPSDRITVPNSLVVMVPAFQRQDNIPLLERVIRLRDTKAFFPYTARVEIFGEDGIRFHPRQLPLTIAIFIKETESFFEFRNLFFSQLVSHGVLNTTVRLATDAPLCCGISQRR